MAVETQDTVEIRAYNNGKAWALDAFENADIPAGVPVIPVDLSWFAAHAHEEAVSLYGPKDQLRTCQFVSGAVDVAENVNFKLEFGIGE